jgi:hypothetical protein
VARPAPPSGSIPRRQHRGISRIESAHDRRSRRPYRLGYLLSPPVKEWLWIHPWWHRFLLAIPAIALALIAFVELRRSEKANELRDEVNRLLGETFPTFWPAAVFFPLTRQSLSADGRGEDCGISEGHVHRCLPPQCAEGLEANDSVPEERGLDVCLSRAAGRPPWSYDQIWRVYQKAAKATGSEHSGRTVFVTRIVPGWIRSARRYSGFPLS